MPNITVDIPEIQESISRPIILDIVRQLNAITKIPKDTLILFPGELEKTYQPGSAMTEGINDRTQFANVDTVIVEIDENFYKDAMSTTAITRPEQLPVFADNALKVYIKPVYVTTEVTINFKFKTKSKTSAYRWRNDIRTRISMMRDINLHDITYHYPLPNQLIAVLKEIHRLRETVGAYGEEFGTYLLNNSTTRLTELSNQSGETKRLGISEKQMQIVGYFDFEGFPEKPEHEDDTGTWVTAFSYKFNYQKALECNMVYPIMVHNQLLPNDYLVTERAYDMREHNKSYSLSGSAFAYFEAQNQIDKYLNSDSLIRIPAFDEMIPETVAPGMMNLFIALSQITEEDKRSLFNLNDLGDYVIDKDVMEFTQLSEFSFMTKRYSSILQLDLYRGRILVSNSHISLDTQVNLKATLDLDVRDTYRITFSIVTDLSLLDKAALDRLKRFPKAMVKILAALNEALRNNPGFMKLGDKSYISNSDLSRYNIDPAFGFNPNGYGNGVYGANGTNGKLRYPNERLKDSSAYAKNRIQNNTIMSTGIIARDGYRTANIDVYRKQQRGY